MSAEQHRLTDAQLVEPCEQFHGERARIKAAGPSDRPSRPPRPGHARTLFRPTIGSLPAETEIFLKRPGSDARYPVRRR
jgi:hypothetical protein